MAYPMAYVATINVFGYQPTDDDLHLFESTQEAWDFLHDERCRTEQDVTTDDLPNDREYSETAEVLRFNAMRSETTCGTVQGDTPGYDGDHDLGLAYTVSEFEGTDEELYEAQGRPLRKALPCGCRPHVTRMTAFGFHCVTEDQGYCNFECPHDEED